MSLNMNDVSDLTITEGDVRTIHDRSDRLLWGKLNYNTYYAGDTEQQSYSGKNLLNIPDGTFSQNGITWTKSGNIANGSGVSTDTYCDLYHDITCSFPAGTYTLTIQNPISQRVTLYLREADNTRHSYNINAGSTSVTFTTNYDAVKQHVTLAGFSSGDTISVSLALQLENGSTSTTFEPYVGGIPAPNPDYPQDVNVVTGEQTVEVHGNNLFDKNTITASQYIDANGDAVSNVGWVTTDYIPIQPNTIYVTKTNTEAGLGNAPARCYYDANKTYISGVAHASANPFTNTSPARAYYMRESMIATAINSAQIVEQPQSYTVDLGTTELCKIGNYQDYIYKSGDDWYLHKACANILVNGTQNMNFHNNRNNIDGYRLYFTSNIKGGTQVYSEKFIYQDWQNYQANSNTRSYSVVSTALTDTNTVYVTFKDNTITTATEFQTWFSNNNTLFYYVEATSTDTQITDTTLITQLNDINEWLTRYGYNSIVSGNLPLIIIQNNL